METTNLWQANQIVDTCPDECDFAIREAQAWIAYPKGRNYKADILFIIYRFLDVLQTADYEIKTLQSLLFPMPSGQRTRLGLSLIHDNVKASWGSGSCRDKSRD